MVIEWDGIGIQRADIGGETGTVHLSNDCKEGTDYAEEIGHLLIGSVSEIDELNLHFEKRETTKRRRMKRQESN